MGLEQGEWEMERDFISNYMKENNSTISISKCRLSLAPITEEISEDLNLPASHDLKSNSADHPPIVEELQTEQNVNEAEATECVWKLKVYKNSFNQTLPVDELSNFQKSRQVKCDVNTTLEEQLKSSKDANKKPPSLKEKLANNHEWDILGILNLSAMNLIDTDMPLIIQAAFSENKTKCIGLILRDNNMTSDGVKTLVDALLVARTKLKYLSFSNNSKVGDVGIEHLIYLFKKKRSINFLALPNTGMTDRGVRLLADLLCEVDVDSPCPPIEKLYISFNKLITDESMVAVIQILERNRTLKVLSMEYCNFSDKVRRILREISTTNKKINLSLSD
ncbi:unnamed protein product [Rotaria magnacalcarata]|uniref:Uncharacterized protein n=2 Tax=Rotaria magnacalcarata TaxID=392030 RepID=A0A816VJR6_9BILA|nr:unnamed protein product [Rotaria magnacalcarata]CAF1510468.1 unnamed protein product [Rotaria magnacalcarata]CAF2128413.1 unnamed protein product [Rotaria magnacalcarata]